MAQVTINQRLKNVRLALNLDQEPFSRALNFRQGTISMIENGKASVSAKLIRALERVFGVRPDYMNKGAGSIFEGGKILDSDAVANIIANAIDGRNQKIINQSKNNQKPNPEMEERMRELEKEVRELKSAMIKLLSKDEDRSEEKPFRKAGSK